MEESLWDIETVARYARVSPSTVWRWVNSGKLLGQKVGKQWRFDPKVVRDAFQQGLLAGVTRSLTKQKLIDYYSQLPDWAKATLSHWRQYLVEELNKLRPEHVILNDRRGSKIWKLLQLNGYTFGQNLWHSTAVMLMTLNELQQMFGHRRVWIFDEMIQHGREAHKLRQRLESKNVNAKVTTVVCIRSRSHAERGELLEYEAHFCEDLDDREFGERAAFISRLAYLFEPPLDPDHVVVKGALIAGFKVDEFLEKLSKWGVVFFVWSPDRDRNFTAITLDRPRFFSGDTSDLPDGFIFDWEGPGKVRFYISPEDNRVYCVFIIHPGVEAPISQWTEAGIVYEPCRRSSRVKNHFSLAGFETDEAMIHHVYSIICLNLAVKLFGDFVKSGAAEEVGIRFDNIPAAFDENELIATFGPSIGLKTLKHVQQILSEAGQGGTLFPHIAQNPVLFQIRRDDICPKIYDKLDCRKEVIKAIPYRYSTDGSETKPISWKALLNYLPQFYEADIGSILDDELDRGRIKPVNWVEYFTQGEVKMARAWRGFVRGEFGPWFEWDKINSYEDIVRQRTLGLGPMALQLFLQNIGKKQIRATHFDKVFANLQHDLWEGRHDLFYISWRPYKYGPVPVVQEVSSSGEYMEFRRFLVKNNCIMEIPEQHGSRVWHTYKPAYDTEVPWQNLWKTKVSPVTRAYVASLMRLYAAIQKQCKTERPSLPGSEVMGIFQDSLIVLASVRNAEIAYKCGWFEVEDWRKKGDSLFHLISSIATVPRRFTEPFLKEQLEDFAEPARLLYNKIEMYRNLPHLRQQIEELVNKEGFDVGEVLLERVDSKPNFDSQLYPVGNLEWACKIMRAFTSLTRQVLTACGLDTDERAEDEKRDGKGILKDASYYLNELLTNCPELRVLEKELDTCIAKSKEGLLSEEISKCLFKTFRLILHTFEAQQRIPDPRLPRFQKEARPDLITVFSRVPIVQPYAIAVADIKNLRGLPRAMNEIWGKSTEESMMKLLEWVNGVAHEIAQRHPDCKYCDLSGDSIILASPDPDKLCLSVLDLIKLTSQRLGEFDLKYIPFGLLRVGIAWRDDRMGGEYQGALAGLIAHDLANIPGQELGTLNVTQAVFDRLSPEHQTDFKMSNQSSRQGKVFSQKWISERDSARDSS